MLHYPYIELRVHRLAPDALLNRNLRHELRHPFQPDVPSLYSRQKSMRVLRAAAIAGSVVYPLEYARLFQGVSPVEFGLAVVVGGIVIAAAKDPEGIAWALARNERDANAFAARTKGFNPIKKT